MDFSQALTQLKAGAKLARSGWNRSGMYIQAQYPDANSNMTQPYIFIVPCEDEKIPWVTSQADVFANDWRIVHG